MYWLIILTGYPAWVYILPIFQLTFNVFLIAFMLRNRVPQFKIGPFILRGFLAPTLITILCAVCAFIPTLFLNDGWLRLICVGLLSTILLAGFSWFVLFDNDMRKEIIEKIKEKLYFR